MWTSAAKVATTTAAIAIGYPGIFDYKQKHHTTQNKTTIRMQAYSSTSYVC